MEKLTSYLKEQGKISIGFSGGVDSTFLLKACVDALGENVLAIIANGPMMAKRDFDEAIMLVKAIGAPYMVLEVSPLDYEEISRNDKKRCYYCKKNIFTKIKAVAAEAGFSIVADGKNTDDAAAYRPGALAIEQLGVISPLYHCGFSKSDIRIASKELGLSTWEKPSNSCLFTRIPYDEQITAEKIKAIEAGEDLLRDAGIQTVRVRAHGTIARIEVMKEDYNKVMAITDLSLQMKKLGYRYITLDLDGFKSGSMD